jgi:1,4-dihydroxy-2-naphthoate octaprenyltransferase
MRRVLLACLCLATVVVCSEQGAAEVMDEAPSTPELTPEAEPSGASQDAPPTPTTQFGTTWENKQPVLRPALALRAARPWSFTATAGPVALGTALAFKIDDAFSVPILLLTLLTTLGVHSAGNLMNTLVDFTRGVDTESSSDLTLVKGELLPHQVAKLIAITYGIATAAAAPLCAISRAPLKLLLSMLLGGAASAFVYTGGPGLKYRALGDVLISATFGPLLVAFAYAAQAGSVSWRPLLASLPLTMHIEAILHANNARDVEEDLANGVRTLAARLGSERSFSLYAALLALPFLAPIYGAIRHSTLALLPMLSAPIARSLAADFKAGVFAGLPKRTAKFQFIFGAALVVGVLLPSPSLGFIWGAVGSAVRGI